jgi:hypothetical protein
MYDCIEQCLMATSVVSQDEIEWNTKATLDSLLTMKNLTSLREKLLTPQTPSSFMENPSSLSTLLFKMLSMNTSPGAKK